MKRIVELPWRILCFVFRSGGTSGWVALWTSSPPSQVSRGQNCAVIHEQDARPCRLWMALPSQAWNVKARTVRARGWLKFWCRLGVAIFGPYGTIFYGALLFYPRLVCLPGKMALWGPEGHWAPDCPRSYSSAFFQAMGASLADPGDHMLQSIKRNCFLFVAGGVVENLVPPGGTEF